MGPADVVLMESTYGGRVHRSRDDTIAEIGTIIKDAHHAHGNILIPAFAIGRSQEVLYTLGKHYDEWGLDNWHVFLDSPMAIDASHIYWDYPHLYDEEASRLRKRLNEMPKLPNLHLTSTPAESQVINRLTSGAIVIAGSGMCNGGRILHHLKHNVWRKQCHVIIVGYQAEGSLGRQLVDGAEYVRIHNETIRIAARIHTVGGLSAHGDEADLVRWYRGFTNAPPAYLVHGEPRAAQALKTKLEADCGARVTIASPGMTVDLGRNGA
jgi:metallo-beta-lactamase family protein